MLFITKNRLIKRAEKLFNENFLIGDSIPSLDHTEVGFDSFRLGYIERYNVSDINDLTYEQLEGLVDILNKSLQLAKMFKKQKIDQKWVKKTG
jgi:hypothetical protein